MSRVRNFKQITKDFTTHLNEIVDSYTNLEYILKISPGHIYWKNEDGVYLGCNDAQAKSFGFRSSQDVIGKTDYDWLSAEEAHSLQKIDREVMRSGVTKVVEEISTRADGKRGLFLSRKTPWVDKKGHIIGIIGISIDITDQKEAEKLAQEKAISDKMIETLQVVAGSISHELRTPLTNIGLCMRSIGATIQSLIHYHEAVESGQEPWQVSRESVDRLKSMLPQIKQQLDNAELVINLQLQSIQEREIDKRFFSEVSMVQCIEKALNQYPFVAKQRALVHWSATHDFMFFGEPHLMTNVLHNLIKNALYFIKSAGKGEIFIDVSSDEQWHYIRFKDTAQGMPPNVAAKVFDKFYTQTQHGTGLGLSFCQLVMEAFGGTIACQTKEGHYAEFILSFPHQATVSSCVEESSITS